MVKTKTWILIFSLLLLICAAAAFLISPRPSEGAVVRILRDGVLLEEIDLSLVTEPRTLEIPDPQGGSNTLRIEPGRICVQSADCPDQVCVHRGWLTDRAGPIVCIPHRLVIEMAEKSGPDTLTR